MNFLSGLHTSHYGILMQANLRERPSWRNRCIGVIMRINLAILFIVITSMHLWATGRAQSVTLSLTNSTLEEALRQIGRQTNYGYIFEGQKQGEGKRLNLTLQNVDIKIALAQCFAQQPYDYRLGNEMIVVTPKSTLLNIASEIPKRIVIIGRITDEQGSPLAGVSVLVKGTSQGTMTDEDGRYSINANPGNVLVFSFIGFQVQEVAVDVQTVINIVLKVVVGQLDALTVVNTGFQQLPKERATGSFSNVNKQQLERQVTPDIISRLEAVTSGVAFNYDYRGNRQIRVRGQNTIFANAEPLIVVDNFPYEGSLDNINPNDIETITISKDAGAASIWGVRAGNGVIVITTKKGRLNQPLNIGLTANLSTTGRPDLYYSRNFLNSNDFINIEQQLFAQGFYNTAENSAAKSPLSPVVELLIKKRDNPSLAASVDEQINSLRGIDVRDDLSRYLYQNSVLQQYSLNFNGGSDKMSYYISAGADVNRGSTVGQTSQRYTLNAQSAYVPIKNLEINTSINYVQAINKTENILSQMPVDIDPYTLLADAHGSPLPIVNNYRTTYVDAALSKGFLNWQFVPLEELGRNTTETNTTENRLMAVVKYTIIKGLSAEVRYQYQKQQIQSNNLNTADSFFARNLINRYSTVNGSGVVTTNNIPLGAILNYSNSSITANNLRGQLNYESSFGKHAISSLAGYEVREIVKPANAGRYYGYDPDVATVFRYNGNTTYVLQPNGSGAIPIGDAISNSTDRFISYYANAAYTYANRYTVSGSARVDGSNFFGVYTNQREVPLWSIGGKWALDKEPFYKITWLPKLSIRATYGFNGNLDKGLSAFTTARYTSAAFWTGARYATIVNPPNPELRWEKTSQYNLGVDFGLRENIISGSIEVYFKKGKDMIGDAIMAPSSGTTSLRGNFARTRGNGIDLIINSNNLNGALKWQTGFLFNYATDKVTAYEVQNTVATLVLNGLGNTAQIYPKEGYPVYGVYSYRWAGLNSINGDPQGYLNGAVSSAYSSLNNPASFNDIVYHGSARPLYTGGMQNTLSYKNLSISFTLNYKFGYYFRQGSIYYGNLFNNGTGYADFVKRWQKPGDENITHVPSMPTGVNAARDQFYNNSEVLVEKGDHVRLQDINISYNLTHKQWKGMPFKSITIFGYARNLGILWRSNKLGLDPDYYLVGVIPPSRSFSFGLRTNF